MQMRSSSERSQIIHGLIAKDSYSRWPERNLAGNAIDFHAGVCMRV